MKFEKLIVGKWAKSSNPYVEFIEFFEDGKIMDPNSGRVGSYTFLDDNRIRVILDSVATIYDEVEITDNRFSFTGKTQNGLRSSFVRYPPKKSERENSQTNDKIGAEKFAKKYIEVCALKDADSAWMMLTPNDQNIVNGIASLANSFADSDEKSSGKEIHIQDTDDPAKGKYDLIPRVNEKNVL